MDARVAFSGAADGRFERIVHHLVTEGTFVPEGLGPDLLLGHFPRATRSVAVLRDGIELDRWIAAGKDTGIEIVVVGGPPPTGKEPPPGVIVWYVAEDGRVHGAGEDLALGEVRPQLEAADRPPDWPAFWARIDAQVAARKEVDAFREGVRDRTPRVTPILIGVNVAFYLLGTTWGAPEYTPALVRMGALYRDRVLEGEVWRLLSSTFLHGDIVHLAVNMYVLWALGSMLERILGPARLLALYACAGIAGSLASLAFSKGFSVGASGAIWGLLAAEMVLAWRGTGILPQAFLGPMRRGALQNLGINVMISFLPGIDWAGHFGGGLLGAAMAGLGVLTKGLPRWAELGPGAKAPPDRVPPGLQVGARVAVAAMAASLVAAIGLGRPWEAAAPPVLVRAPLGATGWTAEVPAGLEPTDAADAREVVLGDVMVDPATVNVRFEPLPAPPTAEEREAAYDEYAGALSDPGTGFRAAGMAERVEVDGATVLERTFRADELLLRRAVVVGDHGVVVADVMYWAEAPDAWGTVARRVAATAAPD